ncbi:MAG: hypothetical protein K8S55_06205 [Phycisphaerae bacterium]|nr:hypothetical protein [Phycisphaerae bacterium]
MNRYRNALSSVLILISFTVFTAAAQAKTLVFIETDAIAGVKEEAAKLGKVGVLAGLAEAKQGAADTIIVAGRLDNKFIAPLVKASGLKVDKKWIGDQGFYIKSIPADKDKGKKILITANTHVGVMYGIIELDERIALKGKVVLGGKFDIKDRPVFTARRGGRRENFSLHWSSEHHYSDLQPYFYREFPEVFPNAKTREDHTKNVRVWRMKLKEYLKTQHDRGCKVFVFAYLPALPGSHFKDSPCLTSFLKAHPEVKPVRRTKTWHPFMCPSHEISKNLMRSKLKELFTDCPKLDGILLNIGENEQSLISCGCAKCEAQSYEERLIEYLKLMLKAMREGNPKAKILLRPWGITKKRGLKSWKPFKKLAGKLPEGVCFYAKLSSPPCSDYAWKNIFNPLVGMDRLYSFGWFILHPNSGLAWRGQLLYNAPWYKARAMKLADMGQKGMASEGGGGAEGDNPFREVSVLAARKIAWDPYRFNPTEFLNDWATKRFGPKAGPYVTTAMKDTWKITDAMVVYPKKSQTVHVMNFVPGRRCGFYRCNCTGTQTKDVAGVTEKNKAALVKRYGIAEAIRLSKLAEENMTKAHELRPDDKFLTSIWTLAKATEGLTRFWSGHHLSIIYNNLANKYKGEKSEEYHRLAVKYSRQSLAGAKKYVKWMYETHPLCKTAFDHPVVSWDGWTPAPGCPSFPTTAVSYNLGRMASVLHQGQNGYNRVVMEPLRAEKYPHPLWEAKCKHPAIEYATKRSRKPENRWPKLFPRLKKKWQAKQYTLDLDGKDAKRGLPQLASPHILPKIAIKFSGDLSKGGMLVVKYVPMGWWGGPRYAYLDVVLDGKKIGTIEDLSHTDITRAPSSDFIRYLELPPTNGKKHELTLLAPRGIGAEFNFVRIYTPDKQTFTRAL